MPCLKNYSDYQDQVESITLSRVILAKSTIFQKYNKSSPWQTPMGFGNPNQWVNNVCLPLYVRMYW